MSCIDTIWVGPRVSLAPEQKTCVAMVPMLSSFSEGSRKEGHAMSTPRDILRWLCAIPVGIIGAVLISFPIHWFVMTNFGGQTLDPDIAVRDPETLRRIELLLRPVFSTLAFVYCAARTAPDRYRNVTSFLAGGAIILGVPIAVYLWNANTISNGSGFLIKHGVYSILGNVIGAIGAIYLIRPYGRQNSSNVLTHKSASKVRRQETAI